MTSTPPSPQEAFVYGQLVNLVRTGKAVTRPALEQETRLGRKLVTQRVQQAMDLGLLEDGELGPSSGGRPSRQLRFRAGAGHVFAGMIAPTEMNAAVVALDGTLIASLHEDWDADSPEPTLARLDALFVRLAKRTRIKPWAFGIGITGPVDFSTGRLVAPPIMPAWDGYSVRAWFRERYDAPVWVDNDVNLMAFGEWHKGSPRDGRDLLYILVDLGIGAGLVSRGRVFRGDTGAAGDIGHSKVSDDPSLVCRCGQVGCLEALTGGWGLERIVTSRAAESPVFSAILAERGRITTEDIGREAAAGEPLASDVVFRGAQTVGETVANLVNFVNPGVVVVGGGALRTGPRMFAELERTVLHRATRLAAQRLSMRPASLDFKEGVIGAGIMAIEHLFDPAAIGLWIDNGSPVGRSADLQKLAAV
jgi:predicted NBD/HSP70 family sugar kinase